MTEANLEGRNAGDFYQYVISVRNAFLNEIEQAWTSEWQLRVLIVECIICIVFVFFTYVAWKIYGDLIQQQFANHSNSDFINSKANYFEKQVYDSKKSE